LQLNKTQEGKKGKKKWIVTMLLQKSAEWYSRMHKRLRLASERSPWWTFIWDWTTDVATWLKTFKKGHHRFSPLIQYRFKSETIQRDITQAIKAALNTGTFHYCLRIDIKSYYASINHQILLDQLYKNYDDPRLRRYFEAIVTTGIDCDGQVFLPKQGIPLRSSLSPFFGALYLTELDRAFENRPGIFYRRYMDDILILVSNKRPYTRVRKRVFAILKGLKLKISPHKTRIHTRSCRRALDRVQAMRKDAVHPANIQRYLSLWATWWKTTIKLSRFGLLYTWLMVVENTSFTSCLWYGRGLFLGSPYDDLLYSKSINQNQGVLV
jgi:hypothetical protein